MDNKSGTLVVRSAKRRFALRAAVLLGTGIVLFTASGCSSNKEPIANTPAGVAAALAPPKIPADVLAKYNAMGQARTNAMRQAYFQGRNPNTVPQSPAPPSTNPNSGPPP